MDLLEEFKSYINKEHLFQLKDKLLIAVSGGIDSVVLCELCSRAGYDFFIAHCNFRLRGEESDRDQEFVNQLAANYHVPFYLGAFDTATLAKDQKKSIEETARDLRYSWFNELLKIHSLKYILTGHHADDNIETVLMHFFRGTGIKGLRGMLTKQGKIIRPLINFRRKDLEEYASGKGLTFVTDHTNLESIYTRNYFRNDLIPAAEKHYPEAMDNILHNITRFRETEILYQQAIAFHKKKLLLQKDKEVHIPVLKLKHSEPLTTIVYEIIKDFDFTAHQVKEIISLLDSESGKYISSSTHRIIKNRNWLIISPLQSAGASHILVEESDTTVEYRGGKIELKKIEHKKTVIPTDPRIAWLDYDEIRFPLLLRKWKPGDYFYPLGMPGKKKLSRFFIDQKLSLTQKEDVWVIEMNKKIVWVVGLRIDERFKIKESTKNILSLSLGIASPNN